ncbi:MAG: ABC transporter substrate-binding protein [Gemmatimonadetes bacterium]|nr:ABC transporter substrate-binding protein [Gemmatimonadota bacterium]MBT6907294.1 ABC transporter substrate-binding protein [Gemmatimonadota bacterium]MBT7586701.1 ABC transporter substrate-binding protein [Gemmatimonadota bacterium]
MKRWLSCLAVGMLLGCGGGGAGGEHKDIPRNRTLIMDCSNLQDCGGQIKDYNTFNPYLLIGKSNTGWNFLYEPLYFYNAYDNKGENIIPWIATGHEYNADYTEVVITIREGVEWSDGQPWTVHDLVFTINMLRDNAPELAFSTDMEAWVKEAVAVDDLTAKITLNKANPRFVFSYFTHNFDNGIPIVPKHIWEGQDPNNFKNFDLAKGWPVVSGPYKIAISVPEQRVWDLRDDWWAQKVGFRDMPKVERIIYLTHMEETKRVQNLISNTMDTSLDIRPPNIRSILDSNPNVSTWSGRELPYGYLDWWPVCLGFNNLEPPFNDPEIRRAVNYAIDRDQLVAIGWQGAGTKSHLPLPDFPPMRKYTDQIQDLIEKYEIGVFDPAKSAAIMERKGYAKDAEGFWAKDGERIKIAIDIFDIFTDLAPVMAAQFKQVGFDASFRMTSDVFSRMAQGVARSFLMGNGGSVRDPYFTMRLYHSRFVQPTGTHAERFWRWSNPEYDALVDQMGQTAPDDPELQRLFREAMEIWLSELPSIPIVQWYHRIPHNETYWKNWPTAENPYINSAYWHNTWLLVLLGLEPAQG